MDVSSSRILVSSSRPNAILIPTIKMTSSTISKNLINPLQIGDASLQKLRSITTTPVVKSTNHSLDVKPTVVIMSNGSPSIKSEPITVNRLVLSNNTTNSTILNGQNGTINLATFVSLLQSNQNSISKLLETPINVASAPSLPPGKFHLSKYILSNAGYLF